MYIVLVMMMLAFNNSLSNYYSLQQLVYLQNINDKKRIHESLIDMIMVQFICKTKLA